MISALLWRSFRFATPHLWRRAASPVWQSSKHALTSAQVQTKCSWLWLDPLCSSFRTNSKAFTFIKSDVHECHLTCLQLRYVGWLVRVRWQYILISQIKTKPYTDTDHTICWYRSAYAKGKVLINAQASRWAPSIGAKIKKRLDKSPPTG